MANRFKLVLLLLIMLGLGLLFVQNQQPLSLQIFCPEPKQFCLYQTRSLPLAAWMGLFILAGTISSLIWQLLNRFATPVARAKNYGRADYRGEDNLNTAQPLTNRRSPKGRWAEAQSSETQDWDYEPANPATNQDDFLEAKQSMSSEYEVRREPETVNRSGSTYSYKFKDKSHEHQNSPDSEVSPRGESEQNINLSKDDEEWI